MLLLVLLMGMILRWNRRMRVLWTQRRVMVMLLLLLGLTLLVLLLMLRLSEHIFHSHNMRSCPLEISLQVFPFCMQFANIFNSFAQDFPFTSLYASLSWYTIPQIVKEFLHLLSPLSFSHLMRDFELWRARIGCLFCSWRF